MEQFLEKIKQEHSNLPEDLKPIFDRIIANANIRADYMSTDKNQNEVLFAIDCMLNDNK